MNAITLPHDVETWARAQVASGNAPSIEAAVAQAVRESQELQAFRDSLDAAEAEPGLDAESVFARLNARFPAE